MWVLAAILCLHSFQGSYAFTHSRNKPIILTSIRGGTIRPNLRGKINVSMVGSDPTLMFHNKPMYQSLGIFALTNTIGLVFSLFTGSHKHLDLLGTGAFALAAIPTMVKSSSRRVLLSSAAVAMWSMKLSGFLCYRAFQLKRDKRLEDVLSSTKGTIQFWAISAVWNVICSLPHTLGTTSRNEGSTISLYIGTVLYFLGFLTETFADYEKWIFKRNHPGAYCNVGLWTISQHPNFFGNFVLWTGVFIMNSDSLIETVTCGAGLFQQIWACRRLALSLLSPLFMWYLFSGQAKGDITNSAQLAREKYGSDPTYERYLVSTPLLFPNISEWLHKLFYFRVLNH